MTLTRILMVAVLGALTISGCKAGSPNAGPKGPEDPAALAEQLWEDTMKRYPTWATYIGDRRYDDQITDMSADARAKWLGTLSDYRERFSRVDAESLTGQVAITARVLTMNLETQLAAQVCERDTWDIDQLNGPQVSFPRLGAFQPVDSPKAVASYLTRLDGIPRFMDQYIANLRLGLRAGRTAPRVVVDRVIAQLDDMVAATPETSPFVAAAKRTKGLDEAAVVTLEANIIERVKTGIQPAFQRYRDFLRDEYVSQARQEIGISANPDGLSCYRALIASHTGSTQSPDKIHEIGMQELELLQAEMLGIAESQGFDSIRAYHDHLEKSENQHVDSREALIAHNEKLVAKAQAKLPEAFGLLPPENVEVIAIEGYREADAPAAYYYSAPDDGSRPAYYYINTFKPETRPLYNMEALAYHEAVPGHHLQIGIAQNLDGLPDIRRHGSYTAYIEGWALYSELVADELGLYSGPDTKFGMLNYQAWRAARLVVDTGMHALGWSRERALKFMMDNLSFPEQEMANEIDRYIIWPGQALSYMLGRMEIQRLRVKAQEALGSRFDVKVFHDQILRNGAVPLPVLSDIVDSWLDTASAPEPAAPAPEPAGSAPVGALDLSGKNR